MGYPVKTKNIAAQATWSDWIYIKGWFNYSLWGTWVATVFLQRTFDGARVRLDRMSSAANTEQILQEPEGAFYRFGVKTGGYTSGTVRGRLAADPEKVKELLSL